MVDLFSGDFNYNIPLFDIGGYPVNISYHGGVSMDQEASWVGLGWNINPGAINRGMRGIPDDFIGDEVHKSMNLKKNKTLGITANSDLEIFGFVGQNKRLKGEKYSFKQAKHMHMLNKFNFGFGVVYNSYKGIGYSLDLSAELSKTYDHTEADINGIQQSSEDAFNDIIERDEENKSYEEINSNLGNLRLNEVIEKNKEVIKEQYKSASTNIFSKSKLKGDLSLSASSQDGASLSGDISYDYRILNYNKSIKSIVPSIGVGYNSLMGISGFTLNAYYNQQIIKKDNKDLNTSTSGSAGIGGTIPINSYSYVPNVQFPRLSTSNSFNATIGFDAFGGHPNMRFNGFYNTEELEDKEKTMKAYGYLYEQESYWNRGKDDVLMDFNREKESNGSKNSTHLPLANHTYDVYSVSGQGTGGIYRPHRKTIGVLYDNKTGNKNRPFGMNDLGIELGFGSNFRFGTILKNKVQRSLSGLWSNDADNQLLGVLNYKMNNSDENKRRKQVYFKAAGESTPSDNDLANNWGGKKEMSLKIGKTTFARNLRFGKVENKLNQNSSVNLRGYSDENPIRNNVITFLTAEESSHIGIGYEPFISSYPLNYWSNYVKSQELPTISMFNKYGSSNSAKAHHISEVISTGGDGMRYVYGIPAYNRTQKEVVFATSIDRVENVISENKEYPESGLVHYNHFKDNSISNDRGVDNFFMSTELPAYAHSYLLTGVLSPDYADLTGDGITDDDYGNAVKFNYHRKTATYNWRTPYEEDMANLDEGYITDNSDSKGSYVYGQKEIWYLQSMESKTHVAEFKLSNRQDGHGVINHDGGLSTSSNNTLMKLDSIVIYSKLDLLINGKAALPVKTIVFQYDYSLCPGVPNNENGQGKLTLKSIYFTYGNSSKGVLNPYRFNYSDFNPGYSHVHYDRWGNYKYADEKLPNRYFPYTDADSSRDVYDKYAGAWSLTKISLPSGGEINVEYEADDYAYVQDRRAMQMFKVVGASNTSEGYPRSSNGKANFNNSILKSSLYEERKNNNYLYFDLNENQSDVPSDDQNQFVLEKYLTDENGYLTPYIYYRFKVNMDPRAKGADHYEYVSGYAEIEYDKCGITSDKKYGYIKLKEVSQGDAGLTKCNPIAKQAWQLGLQSLRKVMYPGSDQSQADVNGGKQSAMKALLNSYGTALNVFTGPYQNLRWKHIAKNFEVNKSFIRLYKPDNFKIGGGSRVKRITINDNWSEMNTNQSSGEYGQEFYYKTKNKNGDLISSGVASYEPFVGNDENPMRRPSFYTTNRFMFPDLNNYIEEPFGESFFPSASVGYSRVTVRNIPKAGAVVTSTGKIVHEFYTYKDFPLITKNTPLKFLKNGGGNSEDENKPGRKRAKKFVKALASLFSVVKRDYMVASQGYSIILNDMHGKMKSMKIYSSMNEDSDNDERQFTGDFISGTEYKYKTEVSKNENNFTHVVSLQDSMQFKPSPEKVGLYNTVWVMKEDGTLVEKEIAVTYDINTDTRESSSHYRHAGLDFNLENFLIMTVPCPYPKYAVNQSLFQSAVVTKVIQQYGILEEVVAYDHSSIVRTKNLVWDEQTGQVLLTATTNEFEDPIFNYTYPAHLAYEGMGPAYKNIDFEAEIEIGNFGDVNTGTLSDETNGMFIEGDELLLRNSFDVDQCLKAWVLKSNVNPTTGEYTKLRLIDIAGYPISSGNYNARVIRSGRKNLSSVPIGGITTMYTNVFNTDSSDRLVLNRDVIQSSAALFSDEWQGYMDRASHFIQQCDTISLRVEDVFALIQSMIETNTSSEYYYIGNELPPPANTLSSYTGTLKQCIESYAKGLSISGCSGSAKTLLNTYFGRTIGSPNIFFFKSEHLCNATNDTSYKFLTCELSVSNEDTYSDITLDSLESIGSYEFVNDKVIRFKAYHGSDSSYFTVDFTSNNCFEQVVCKYVRSCNYLVGKNINPFVNNIKGVWRQKEGFAFNSERVYESKSNNNTNIRKDGVLKNYEPFWNFRDSSINGVLGTGSEKWVSIGQATVFAPEGHGIEEKDALGIYASQLFGYNNLLVTAQASNARYIQIANDNFEDYFSPYVGCDVEKHFDFRKGLNLSEKSFKTYDNDILSPIIKQFWFSEVNSSSWLAKDTAHTGFYSLCVASGNQHSNVRQIDYSGLNFADETDSFYRIKSINNVITPFAPTVGKYVASAWVFENYSDQNAVNNYESAYLNVKVYNGGSAVVDKNFVAKGKIINQWQRIEGYFEVPEGADSIKVTLVNGSEVNAYFDDIRIHPFDSRMVSNVYDYQSFKVIAMLDDNNYATFYEYDDEGTLIRVKKETENGIMTIQESRKSIRKKIN
jgi:hypothetical protein